MCCWHQVKCIALRAFVFASLFTSSTNSTSLSLLLHWAESTTNRLLSAPRLPFTWPKKLKWLQAQNERHRKREKFMPSWDERAKFNWILDVHSRDLQSIQLLLLTSHTLIARAIRAHSPHTHTNTSIVLTNFVGGQTTTTLTSMLLCVCQCDCDQIPAAAANNERKKQTKKEKEDFSPEFDSESHAHSSVRAHICQRTSEQR